MTRCRHRDKALLTNWFSEYQHENPLSLTVPEEPLQPPPPLALHDLHHSGDQLPEQETAGQVNDGVALVNQLPEQDTAGQANDGLALVGGEVEGGGPNTRARARARLKKSS